MENNGDTPPGPPNFFGTVTSMDQILHPRPAAFNFAGYLNDAPPRMKGPTQDGSTPEEKFQDWKSAADKCKRQLETVTVLYGSLLDEDAKVMKSFQEKLDRHIRKCEKTPEALIENMGKTLIQSNKEVGMNNLLEAVSGSLEVVLKKQAKPDNATVKVLVADLIPRAEEAMEQANGAKK